ncbi:succinyltransferase-like protein [Glaciihabitans tibetensis]|uniref:Succinyltransferase-like protein n=1 Tax=Glaciihabitans tibetensis TaxID=1266600 RepID=A0A2T0V3B9_9MICO|nr:succinyltransferase-like protein [Glaciihabitans tibetensis]
MEGVSISRDGAIRIGENVFVNSFCYFDAAESISVGDGTRIGDHVRLVTSTHSLGGPDQRAGAGISSPISIGRGVWLGSSVVVLPGVTIGDGCVIAAGAVVTRSTAQNGLYAGVPAKRIKDLPGG